MTLSWEHSYEKRNIFKNIRNIYIYILSTVEFVELMVLQMALKLSEPPFSIVSWLRPWPQFLFEQCALRVKVFTRCNIGAYCPSLVLCHFLLLLVMVLKQSELRSTDSSAASSAAQALRCVSLCEHAYRTWRMKESAVLRELQQERGRALPQASVLGHSSASTLSC